MIRSAAAGCRASSPATEVVTRLPADAAEVERVWGPPKLSSNKRRAQVGHPWRLKAAKMPVAKSKPDKSMYVWLLDNPLEGDINEFMFQEDQVLLKCEY